MGRCSQFGAECYTGVCLVDQHVCLCVCLPVCIFICSFVCLSVCLSVYTSTCPSIHSSVHLSVRLPVSICLSACLSVSDSVPSLLFSQQIEVDYLFALLEGNSPDPMAAHQVSSSSSPSSSSSSSSSSPCTASLPLSGAGHTDGGPAETACL